MSDVPWMDWYQSLAKPSWTPAPRTIGLIWSILYPIILVTFGFVFVHAARGKLPWRVALPFAINLVANLIFSPIQFRMRNLPLASADILIVLVTIPWMMASIRRHHLWLALAQIPYLVWVLIATVLQLLITASNVSSSAMKTHVSSFGIAMTIVGVTILYWFSPLNESVIDGGDYGTDFRELAHEDERKNCGMRVGVVFVVAGSVVQILANYWSGAN